MNRVNWAVLISYLSRNGLFGSNASTSYGIKADKSITVGKKQKLKDKDRQGKSDDYNILWKRKMEKTERGQPGSNRWPLDLQSNALPLSYAPCTFDNREICIYQLYKTGDMPEKRHHVKYLSSLVWGLKRTKRRNNDTTKWHYVSLYV